MIGIDEFNKVEITIGEIVSAEKVVDTDKLLKLEVDFNEEAKRQIVSGIAQSYPDPNILVGKLVPFVTNLEPRTIKGLESQGMILAAKGEDGPIILTVDSSVPKGRKVS